MKKYLLPVLFSIATLFSNAQTTGWQWAKTSAGANTSEADYVTSDAAGNVYVAGSFSTDSIHIANYKINNYANNGTSDIFVVKYDANGNVLWVKNFGGTDNDAPNGIATDAAGNVYLTGLFHSPTFVVGSTFTNATSNAYLFTARLNTNGIVMWAKSAAATGNNFSYSIATDQSSNVYVTGYYSGPSIDLGTGLLLNKSQVNGVNIFLVKYDSLGTVKWAKTEGGTTRDFAFSVTAGNAGDVYLTGSFGSDTINFGSSQLINGAGSPSTAFFLVRYDTAGNVKWAKTAAADYSVFSNNVATDNEGGVYVSGDFDSDDLTFGSTTLVNNCISSVFNAKYDTAGNVLWANNPLIDASEEAETEYFMASDGLGNTYTIGNFSNDSITLGAITLINPSPSVNNFYIAGYDKTGKAFWAENDFGAANLYGVSADNNGNVYLAGKYSGMATFGSKSVTSSTGDNNMFVAKYSALATGIRTVSGINNSLNIFPNPSQGKFIVQLNGSNATGLIEVYDVVGRMVYQSALTNLQKDNYYQLNLSTQPAGVYFVQLKKEGVWGRQKIVIAK